MDVVFEVTETLKTQLPPPLNILTSLGVIDVYKELEDTENLEIVIEEVEIAINTLGMGVFRPIIFDAKGKIYEINSKFEQAIIMYKKEFEINPTDFYIYRKIGCCYRKITKFKEAEEYIKKALKHSPFNPKTNYELALLYYDWGKKEKALEHLKITLEVWKDADPEYIPAQEARELMVQLISK